MNCDALPSLVADKVYGALCFNDSTKCSGSHKLRRILMAPSASRAAETWKRKLLVLLNLATPRRSDEVRVTAFNRR